MKTFILKYLILCFVGILAVSCNNESEEDLLTPKVYFENNEYRLEVEDENTITYDLQARLSTMSSSSVDVSYAIADASAVEEYNKKHGTEYEAFDASNASLSSNTATIEKGEIYANKTILELKNLNAIEEGKPCLLPVRITSSSIPAIDKTSIVYIIISKPVRIMKVGRFYSNSIKVPLVNKFKSVTYEALIYISRFGSNNTIMGTEGVLILRIGDTALPGGHNDWIQIAGSKQYHSTETFTTGQWYHVAFTYDQPSGKTAIYINGKKATESTWDTPEFDLTSDGGGFFIGKIDGFMWGERPFYGYMSEVRLWNVSRSENQIQQNMLNVDPKSDGLAAYYKLNGTDQYQGDDGKWYVKDASGHNMDGIVNGGRSALNITDLETPVVVK